ncbi:MAG: integrase arm-type DNA-binding domain-containing protein [Deltaproteobacteria bacterium]|nr:integrase arm-type DNA-binding domain-containing protein [Deltaproteobacteria bacterium]
MKNGKKKLTDFQIKNLKAKDKRYTEWGERGFGVRVTPNGVKTFIFKYRFDGKVRWMTLGIYPQMTLADAHEAHGDAWKVLRQGIDPGAQAIEDREVERQAPTVAYLASKYLEEWAMPRKRSWKTDKRILEKDVLPEWGRRKVRDITRRDVKDLLRKVLDRGGIMANRTLALIRKMFNYAVDELEIISVSPCLKIKAPAPENQRDRVLTAEEIRGFWHGLDGEGMKTINPFIRFALKLELATAQRKGECCAAAWEEIDLEEGWWTIPAEKTMLRENHGVEDGLAKNKLPHRVHLTALAIKILQAAKALSGDSPWVFPSPRTNRPITPPAVNHAMRLRLNSLGFTFVPHDLRRTAASHMTGMGISRLVVSKILNHAERGVTAVYDRHSYDGEKRQALDSWGRKLQAIIEGTKSNVVSMIRGV